VAIEVLVSRGTSKAAVARLLGVSEGTVRYYAGRMSAERVEHGQVCGPARSPRTWRALDRLAVAKSENASLPFSRE